MEETLEGTGRDEYSEGDAEMSISEAGTEDQELRDILEREGMDLNTMVEQWKERGLEHIPTEEMERVNFLLRAQQEVETKGQKRGHEANKFLGIKVQGIHQTNQKAKPRCKRGIQSNNEALQELGQMLLKSGKMKPLEAFTSSS